MASRLWGVQIRGFRRRLLVCGVLGSLALTAWLLLPPMKPGGTARLVYRSPDGRFDLAVYRSSRLFGMMPGQSGDAPGHVCLFEVASGRLLKKSRVEMVGLVDRVEWTATNVSVPLIVDWPLPRQR